MACREKSNAIISSEDRKQIRFEVENCSLSFAVRNLVDCANEILHLVNALAAMKWGFEVFKEFNIKVKTFEQKPDNKITYETISI